MLTDLEIALLTIGELEVKRRKAALALHEKDEQIMDLERALDEARQGSDEPEPS